MPVAPIVIAVSPPESSPELRRALLEACGRAVKVADCVDRASIPDGDGESAIAATVTWSSNEYVRLEVTLRKSNQRVEREIDFGARDALQERWRTAGLVVGTLASVLSRNELPSAGELPEVPETPAQPEGPGSAEPGAPEAEPALPAPGSGPRDTLLRSPHGARAGKARQRTDVLVDASALVAPAIVGGPFRSGGEIGGRLRLSVLPVEPAAAVAYSESLSEIDGVDMRTLDAFLGVAVTGKLGGPFSSVARGEGFVRWLETSADASGPLSPTERSRVLGGARVGLDGLLRVTEPFSVFVGAAGLFAAGSTDVTVRHQAVGRGVPALSYMLRAGVSLEL